MNIQQITQVKGFLDQLLEVDIEEKALIIYKDRNTFKETYANTIYTIEEFINNHNRFIKQLKFEINKGLKTMLPYQYNFQNDFGSGNLVNDLQNYLNYINANQFQNAESFLVRLVYYQIYNGFWDKSRYKIHSVNEVKLADKESEIKQIILTLKQKEETYNRIINEAENLNNQTAAFLQKCNDDLSEISENHAKAKILLNEITENANISENLKIQINSIIEQQEKYLKDTIANLEDEKNQFDVFKKENKELHNLNNLELKKLTTKNKDFKSILEFAESKKEWLEEKENEINRLTGMAADSAMGSRYYDREVKLEKGLLFWKYAVPGITILAIVWVIVVFTFLQTDTTNDYFDLLINLLKTSPSFILMGFVFNQYKKERNLQEEYAFKSAVAMTITAYSDLLKNEDTDVNKSRQQSLLKAIEQIQTPPKLYQEKSNRMFSFNTKDLNESVKNLTDVVKNSN